MDLCPNATPATDAELRRYRRYLRIRLMATPYCAVGGRVRQVVPGHECSTRRAVQIHHTHPTTVQDAEAGAHHARPTAVCAACHDLIHTDHQLAAALRLSPATEAHTH